MKKFEEEFDKNIDVVEVQLYESETVIKSCNPNQVKRLGHGWVSLEDHQAEIAKLNSKIDWLHGLLDERNEEVLQTVKLLNEAQPEIPEFVGKYIKETADPIHEMCAWSEHYGDNGTKCDDPELSKMLDWFGMNRNMFYEAVIKGYTVKEELFYLKSDRELESRGDTCIGYVTLYLNNDGYFTTNRKRARKFIQSEIDSMDIGSCEKVEVTD